MDCHQLQLLWSHSAGTSSPSFNQAWLLRDSPVPPRIYPPIALCWLHAKPSPTSLSPIPKQHLSRNIKSEQAHSLLHNPKQHRSALSVWGNTGWGKIPRVHQNKENENKTKNEAARLVPEFNGKTGERKWESKLELRATENLPIPTTPKSSLTQQDDSSMFRVSDCWLGETSHCCIKPSISDVRFPPSQSLYAFRMFQL